MVSTSAAAAWQPRKSPKLTGGIAFTHQIFSLSRILLLTNQPQTSPPPNLGAVPWTPVQIEVSCPDEVASHTCERCTDDASYIQEETLILVRKVIGTAISHTKAALTFIYTLAVTYSTYNISQDLSTSSNCCLQVATCLQIDSAKSMPRMRGVNAL